MGGYSGTVGEIGYDCSLDEVLHYTGMNGTNTRSVTVTWYDGFLVSYSILLSAKDRRLARPAVSVSMSFRRGHPTASPGHYTSAWNTLETSIAVLGQSFEVRDYKAKLIPVFHSVVRLLDTMWRSYTDTLSRSADDNVREQQY